MRYLIELAYDGGAFCGWQIQPSDPSVQEALERALETLLKVRTGVTGAGRTDTGVNASYYVAHFDADGQLDCKQLKYKLNAILPKVICILSVTQAEENFHARFDAIGRQYTYYLHRVKDPFLERTSYFYGYPEVDFEAMNRAAGLLLGTHNFSCFEKSGGDNKTSVCTVYEARWEPYRPELCAGKPGAAAVQADYWRFVIEADRFLRNMVRAIVGTLLEVGRGRRSMEDFASLVLPPDAPEAEASRRSSAGESVPGHALFLSDIRY